MINKQNCDKYVLQNIKNLATLSLYCYINSVLFLSLYSMTIRLRAMLLLSNCSFCSKSFRKKQMNNADCYQTYCSFDLIFDVELANKKE